MEQDLPHQATHYLRQHFPATFKPQLGLVLGSGLGAIADKIEQAIKIPYPSIPGFPPSNVAGHAGQLIAGYLNNTPIICLQGRSHRYEGENRELVKCLIRTLKLLGCSALLITNASGSLRKEVNAGELLLITDHINFSFNNPLVGSNEDEYGDRFIGMDNAYDRELSDLMRLSAHELTLNLAEGVYCGVLGPTFETPAEIRAFRLLGSDAIGMSTVPEVIIARHCKLRVVAVAAITNLAADISPIPLSHEQTLHYGAIAAKNLEKLIYHFAGKFHHDN